MHPGRYAVFAFALCIVVGTLLLLLPISRTGAPPWPDGAVAHPELLGAQTPWRTFTAAMFTAVSAVCVTGLAVVDTATYWSDFGRLVILALIQVGGLGVMVVATVIASFVIRHVALGFERTTASQIGLASMNDAIATVKRVIAVVLGIELAGTLSLGAWLALVGHEPPLRAAWHGLFLAVSAYNNAGFAPYTDNLMSLAADPVVNAIICLLVILGGLGFPLYVELWARLRQRRLRRSGQRRGFDSRFDGLRPPPVRSFSAAGRAVIWGSVILLVSGTLFFWARETAGGIFTAQPWWQSLTEATFASVSARTAGFNSVDLGAMAPSSQIVTMGLMFIGGGPAGTAGGIKITTVAVILAAMVAELRGHDKVTLFNRRIPDALVRKALAVTTLSVLAIGVGFLAVNLTSSLPAHQVAFEVVSAFATTGLSTGITPYLGDFARFVLMALMFAGRIGPMTLATVLELRREPRAFNYPAETPLIG